MEHLDWAVPIPLGFLCAEERGAPSQLGELMIQKIESRMKGPFPLDELGPSLVLIWGVEHR
jgi:hypothetical protein